MNAAAWYRPWRDPAFRLFWGGATVSMAGAQITVVVLPVLVYQLTGSPGRTALILVVQALPYLLFGMLAGAVADRAGRRVLMVTCDLTSAVAVASVPVADAMDTLTLPHIYGVALVTATAFVWRDAASFGALPAIVGRDGLGPTMSILTATWSVLQIAAPAVGGILVATIGPAQALWCESVGYLAAACSLLLIRRSFGSGTGRGTRMRAQITEGIRYVRRHRVIWPLTIMGFGLSLTTGAVMGLLVVYGVRVHGLAQDDARLGWLYSAAAVGSLLAVSVLPALIRRFGQPRLDLRVRAVNVVFLGAVIAAPRLELALAALLLWYGTLTMAITGGITLRQQLTPDQLQGRVNATARMIAWGGQPVGAALGGALAEVAGVRTAMLVVGAGAVLAVVYGWTSDLRRVDRAEIAALQRAAEDKAPMPNEADRTPTHGQPTR